MRLYPEKLAAHLQQQFLPVYLVSGDDPLLVQECCDLIRQKAREQGCSEREIIDGGISSFKWQDILHSATSMSLFAERKLVELRLPSGKPGAEGSKALCEYLDIASGEDVLLIIAGKIDKQSTNSKWYKALDKAGATIQVWPVDAKELPRWLQQRVRNAGMSIDQDALQLLCDRVEGNLLAAVQEVEKLKLLAKDSQIMAKGSTWNAAAPVPTAMTTSATPMIRQGLALRCVTWPTTSGSPPSACQVRWLSTTTGSLSARSSPGPMRRPTCGFSPRPGK